MSFDKCIHFVSIAGIMLCTFGSLTSLGSTTFPMASLEALLSMS